MILKNLVFIFILRVFQSMNAQHLQFPTQEYIVKSMNEAMKNSDLPALIAIGINKQDQKAVFTYGYAVWNEPGALSTDHIFRIYSMTKLITCIAVMQLVEQDRINLEEDVSPLLPELAAIPILTASQLAPARQPILLKHLLTHTSGLGYRGTDRELSAFDQTG